MNTTSRLASVLFAAVAACAPPTDTKDTPPPAKAAAPAAAAPKRVPSGKNVVLEILPDGTRRVRIEAEVCQREGALELFLCRKGTKEHEAVLAADLDAREVHKALIVAEGKPGSPVKHEPRYVAASGSTIRVLVEAPGKPAVNAREWVRHATTKTPMEYDWVFAGSRLYEDPDDPKQTRYAANGGDVICVSNFDTAMLDLPVASSKDNANLEFECFTDRIPPVGTKVTVILEVKK